MISFSANVKRELCRTAPGAKCCALAEMLGALLYANHFSASCIRIVTENPEFAARLPRLLQRGFGLRFDALPGAGSAGQARARAGGPGKNLACFHALRLFRRIEPCTACESCPAGK